MPMKWLVKIRGYSGPLEAVQAFAVAVDCSAAVVQV
jgi:hypothetical protein